MPNIVMAFVALIILSSVPSVQAAEFEVHPSLGVSGEFTDNVFETNTNRISDYITRALPGVVMSYKAPLLAVNVDYLFDYRDYARNTHKDEVTHALSAKGQLTAVQSLLFLDVSEEYQRVSLDVTRDVTRESLFVNQSDRNVVSASPYITVQPTARIAVKSGYRFVDTIYSSSLGVDKTDHVAFLNMTYELVKRWSLTADYAFTRELADNDDFNRHQILGGFRYEYADKSFLFAQGGNTRIRYERGRSFDNNIWNAGLTHQFDTATATIVTGVRYNEDPLRNIIQESFVSGTLEKRFERGALGLSPYYSEYVLTETDSLQTKKYGAVAQGSYEILPDFNGRVALTSERYQQWPLRNSTVRFQVDSGLSYLLARLLTASFSYVYVDYSSPDIVADNRHVNRVMVELKKTF